VVVLVGAVAIISTGLELRTTVTCKVALSSMMPSAARLTRTMALPSLGTVLLVVRETGIETGVPAVSSTVSGAVEQPEAIAAPVQATS
jgi:hypothetical protein